MFPSSSLPLFDGQSSSRKRRNDGEVQPTEHRQQPPVGTTWYTGNYWNEYAWHTHLTPFPYAFTSFNPYPDVPHPPLVLHQTPHKRAPQEPLTPPQKAQSSARIVKTPVKSAPVPSVLDTPESEKSLSLSPLKEVRGLEGEIVDGRFPKVGVKSKYDLGVAELKRRAAEPECMNLSTLCLLFRLSKKKNVNGRLREALSESGLEVRRMQHQRRLTVFSPLLERETIELSKDLDHLYEEFYPTQTVGKRMLMELLKTGKSPEDCLSSLLNSLSILTQLIDTLESRQPAVNGRKEKVKGNDLDVPYENFSRMTHGYGHVDSLVHYKSFKKIFEQAIQTCAELSVGLKMEPVKRMEVGDQPWKLKSDWKFREVEKRGTPPDRASK